MLKIPIEKLQWTVVYGPKQTHGGERSNVLKQFCIKRVSVFHYEFRQFCFVGHSTNLVCLNVEKAR